MIDLYWILKYPNIQICFYSLATNTSVSIWIWIMLILEKLIFLHDLVVYAYGSTFLKYGCQRKEIWNFEKSLIRLFPPELSLNILKFKLKTFHRIYFIYK